MKKAVSFILIISVIFLLVFSLVACESSKENKILGTWVNDIDTSNITQIGYIFDSITFNKDHTISGISRKDNAPMKQWTWSYNKERDRYDIVGENNVQWYAKIEADGSMTLLNRGENGYAIGNWKRV